MKVVEGKSVYSVTEVNNLARQSLETLSFWVEGEISSFKGINSRYRYLYFDLKDPQTEYKLPCVCDPGNYRELNLALEDGQKVIALGNLTLYEKGAQFQMYIHKIEEFGQGSLLAQIEKLKLKLEEKGYFAGKHKKELPRFPTNIAVISSIVSDAWQDFKKHSVDRFGVIKASFFDVKVQGISSSTEIIKAIHAADKMNFDAIILIRGGGSLEDLAAYNNEKLADAIYDAKTCIVAGVGHERDVTIAQLVADIAASTPTDAAKIVTADYATLEVKLNEYLDRIVRIVKYKHDLSSQKSQELYLRTKRSMSHQMESNAQNMDVLFNKLITNIRMLEKIPVRLQFLMQCIKLYQEKNIAAKQRQLEAYKVTLINDWRYITQNTIKNLSFFESKLKLLSPESTLKRGYSITVDEQNMIVRDAATLAVGQAVRVKFEKGKIISQVLEKEE